MTCNVIYLVPVCASKASNPTVPPMPQTPPVHGAHLYFIEMPVSPPWKRVAVQPVLAFHAHVMEQYDYNNQFEYGIRLTPTIH